MRIWKDIDAAPGYQVSDLGQIKSLRRYKDGRLLKPGPAGTNGEYQMVVLMVNEQRKNYLVHRLVLQAFVGPCPEGMESRHIDGDSSNNCLTNLEWSTHMDNMQDKVAHGTLHQNRASGDLHKSSALTSVQVEQIRVDYAAGGVTHQQLADRYHTSRQNVGLIINRKNWKKV